MEVSPGHHVAGDLCQTDLVRVSFRLSALGHHMGATAGRSLGYHGPEATE